jgi:hypothetical protein
MGRQLVPPMWFDRLSRLARTQSTTDDEDSARQKKRVTPPPHSPLSISEFVVMMMAEWEIQLYLFDKPIIIITMAARRRGSSSSSSSPILAFVHVAAAAVVSVPTICDEKLQG